MSGTLTAARAAERRARPKRRRLPFSVVSSSIALAVVTTSWTGVVVGGVNLTDILLSLAIGLLAASVLGGRRIWISGWMLAPTVGAIVSYVIDVYFRAGGAEGNQLFIAKMLLGTTMVAVFVQSETVAGGAPRLRRLLACWVNGVTVNSLVATLIGLGFAIQGGWLETPPTGDRVSGLAFHPNSLAFSLVLALPMYVYMLANARTKVAKLWWLLGLALCLRALFLANSRAGFIVGLVALGLALIVTTRTSRFRRFTFLFVGAGLIVSYFSVLPLLATTRLYALDAQQSTIGRLSLNGTSVRYVLDHPFIGGGFAAPTGVAVPLELLPVGGLLLAGLYYFFFTGALRHFGRGSGLIGAQGWIVAIAVLSYGLLSPGATERATFWPLLLLAGLVLCQRRSLPEQQESAR